MIFLWAIFVLTTFTYVLTSICLANKTSRDEVCTQLLNLAKKEKPTWPMWRIYARYAINQVVQFVLYFTLFVVLVFGAFKHYIPYIIGYCVFGFFVQILDKKKQRSHRITALLMVFWGVYSFFNYLGSM